MIKLIVWSGGLDSTALILKCLEENIPFETLYIASDNVSNGCSKIKSEIYARKIIKKLLTNHYNYPWADRIIRLGYLCNSAKCYNIGQPYLWQIGILRGINKNIDEVWLGYIRKDDFWHNKTEFENAFYANLDMIRTDGVKYPKLVYPIEWSIKENLIDKYYLTKIGKKIFKHIWTCENSKYIIKPCGSCNTCNVFKEIKKYYNERLHIKGKLMNDK